MEGMAQLHGDIMFFLMMIFIIVVYLLFTACSLFMMKSWNSRDLLSGRQYVENVYLKYVKDPKIVGMQLEVVWTIVPAALIGFILYPSLSLLYAMDPIVETSLVVKMVGSQWYWTYEFNTFIRDLGSESNQFIFGKPLVIDSYMIQDDDLRKSKHRWVTFLFSRKSLCAVDKPLFLPIQMPIKLLFTSADVMHSWSVPSLGVKVDAMPGRLNQAFVFLTHEGVYKGRCYELCGVYHGYMPIMLVAVPMSEYIFWTQIST